MENNSDDYLIKYEDIKNLSINDALKKLEQLDGKELSKLRLVDLTICNNQYIFPGHGIYLFRQKKEIVYVGKVRSMSFIERIPKHFDLRHSGWFNRLLKIICLKKLGIEHSDENLLKAHTFAFSHLNLVLIDFGIDKNVDKIERLFRSCTGALNSFKKVKHKNVSQIIDTY